MLDAGRDFGRYLDVDGDGIPYRTYPGTHPSKGGYFTRGTTKDRYARYTEEGPAYVDNMQRLLRKFETAKDAGARARDPARRPSRAKSGVIWFGSTGAAMSESLAALEADGIHLDRCACARFRSPTPSRISSHAHEHVFVVEQNRDAQMKSLLVNECGIDPAKLISVLHYDGTPITARFITREIAEKARLFNVRCRCERWRHDLPRQTEDPPSVAAEERARLHPPRLRRRHLDAVRRLRPRFDLGRDHPGVLRARRGAAPRRQAVGHRLLVEDADVFPRQLARLQQRARPHAVGADRRRARQPRPDLPRRFRRRRFGVDRPRPVRARPAPRREHGLHRREQRRVRPDQGPVLGHRRQGQQEQAAARSTATSRSTSRCSR